MRRCIESAYYHTSHSRAEGWEHGEVEEFWVSGPSQREGTAVGEKTGSMANRVHVPSCTVLF